MNNFFESIMIRLDVKCNEQLAAFYSIILLKCRTRQDRTAVSLMEGSMQMTFLSDKPTDSCSLPETRFMYFSKDVFSLLFPSLPLFQLINFTTNVS